MSFDSLLTELITFIEWAPEAIFASFMRLRDDLYESVIQTLYMVSFSTLLSLGIGFLLAIVLITTGAQGLSPRPRVYVLLDFCVNVGRSLPFIILIIAILPLTRFVMGTTIGTTAAILPLTVAAAPFAARLIEGSFLEVDKGVVEAARSFGAGNGQIILKVMLPEALPSIVLNTAILAITLISYSAMAGTVGGGGLGDLAYRIGYQRFQTDATVWCVILLIIMVQVIQLAGNWCYRALRVHR